MATAFENMLKERRKALGIKSDDSVPTVYKQNNPSEAKASPILSVSNVVSNTTPSVPRIEQNNYSMKNKGAQNDSWASVISEGWKRNAPLSPEQLEASKDSIKREYADKRTQELVQKTAEEDAIRKSQEDNNSRRAAEIMGSGEYTLPVKDSSTNSLDAAAESITKAAESDYYDLRQQARDNSRDLGFTVTEYEALMEDAMANHDAEAYIRYQTLRDAAEAERQAAIKEKNSIEAEGDTATKLQRIGLFGRGLAKNIGGAVVYADEVASQMMKDYKADYNAEWRQAMADYEQMVAIRDAEAAAGASAESVGKMDEAIELQRQYMDSVAVNTVVEGTKGAQLLEEAARDIETSTLGTRKATQFAANAVSAVAPTVATLPLKFVPVVGSALQMTAMGLIGAGQKAYEEREHGATEAFWRGLASGAAEALTERLPIDTLTDILAGAGGKSLVKNLLSQAGAEAGEEAASYVLNYMLDKAAQDPEAEFSVQELFENAAMGAVGGAMLGAPVSTARVVFSSHNRIGPNGLIEVESDAENAKANARPSVKPADSNHDDIDGQLLTLINGDDILKEKVVNDSGEQRAVYSGGNRNYTPASGGRKAVENNRSRNSSNERQKVTGWIQEVYRDAGSQVPRKIPINEFEAESRSVGRGLMHAGSSTYAYRKSDNPSPAATAFKNYLGKRGAAAEVSSEPVLAWRDGTVREKNGASATTLSNGTAIFNDSVPLSEEEALWVARHELFHIKRYSNSENSARWSDSVNADALNFGNPVLKRAALLLQEELGVEDGTDIPPVIYEELAAEAFARLTSDDAELVEETRRWFVDYNAVDSALRNLANELNIEALPLNADGESAESGVGFFSAQNQFSSADESADDIRLLDAYSEVDQESVLKAAGEEWRAEFQKAQDASQRLGGPKVVATYSLAHSANGRYDPATNTIYISMAAKNPVMQVFKHELTHHLKTVGSWGELQDIALQNLSAQLAKEGSTIGDYRKYLENTYRKAYGSLSESEFSERIEEEMVAHYVEEYLFKDDSAIEDLVQQSESLAKRILARLQSWVQTFTGSLSADQIAIQRAERAFAKALMQKKNSAAESGERYAINTDSDGKSFVVIEEDILRGVSKSKYAETVRSELRKRFPKGFYREGWHIELNAKGIREFIHSKSSTHLYQNERQVFDDKMRVVANMDELISIANDYVEEEPSHKRKDNLRKFTRATVRFEIGNRGYDAELITGIYPNGKEIFYDIVNITPTEIKKEAPTRSVYRGDPSAQKMWVPSENNYMQNPEEVNDYSLDGGISSYLESVRSGAGDESRYSISEDILDEQGAEAAEGAQVSDYNAEDPRKLKGYGAMQQEIDSGESGVINERFTFGDVEMAQQLGKRFSYNQSLNRVLDGAANNDPAIREWLRNKVERPFNRAKKAYVTEVKTRKADLKQKMDKLGIKAGSKESAAIMWLGEGKQLIGTEGESRSYSLEDLKLDFPDTWQKIVEAEKYFRAVYNEYVERINTSREMIYADPEGDMLRKIDKKTAELDYYRKRRDELMTLSAAGEDVSKDIKRLDTTIQLAEGGLQALLKDYEEGNYLRGKRLIPRKDYFKHFVEIQQGIFQEVQSILNSPTEIDPKLVGVSDNTKPKSKWQGFYQKRTGRRYTEDAVAGLEQYINQAEFSVSIDPYIAKMRGFVQGMAEATQRSRNANRFIEWMTNWINDLAGKTNFIDRAAQIITDRRAMKAVEWLAGRYRANSVVLNFGSAISQFFNIPNATLYVGNPKSWAKGIARAAAARISGNADSPIKDSVFYNERYLDSDTDFFKNEEGFKRLIQGKVEHFSGWLLEFGDRIGTNIIWNVAYEDAVAKGVADPIEYADDITQRSVAGRGIGEQPLVQKARLTKLVAPFQIEVSNAYYALKERFKVKNAWNVILFLISSWLFNSVSRAILGRSVSIDLVQATIDAVKEVSSLPEDEEDEDKELHDYLKAPISVAGRVGGEILSNVPFASAAIPLLVDDDYYAEKLFGENDPTRFGTGVNGISDLVTPLVTAVADVANGEKFNPDFGSIIENYALPYGGRQVGRAVDALQAYRLLPGDSMGMPLGYDDPETNGIGDGLKDLFKRNPVPGSFNADGNLRFTLDENDWIGLATAMLLGEYSTPEGRAYLESGRGALNPDQTAEAVAAYRMGDGGLPYEELKGDLNGTTWEKGEPLAKSKAYKEVIDEYAAEYGFSHSEKEALYEMFGVSEKVW